MDLAGLKVTLKRTEIEWTTEKPTLYRARRSPDFKVSNTSCGFEVCCSYGDKYALFLRADGASPFRVTAYLSRGSDLFLPQTQTVKDAGAHCVWVCKKSEIAKAVPEFQHQARCCFKVVFDVTHDCKVLPAEAAVRTPCVTSTAFGLDSLRSDLNTLLSGSGPDTADVELQCGLRTFRAHGCLLSARSDVFRAMLGSDMLEGKTGRVDVRDTDPDVFDHFLRYLYTAELPELTDSTAELLYEVADRYNVEALKVQCGRFLIENLTPDSACDVLALADRHCDSVLKDSTLACMLEKNTPLQGEAWSNFCSSHPVLSNEVLHRFGQSVASSE